MSVRPDLTTAERTRSRALLKLVLAHYKKYGRHHLPWRHTHDPYKVLVSEMMLQQTQVDRVVPKYKAFIKRFPSARALARSKLILVLREWQGLGYNRRAKYLWEAAKGGSKGIGPYTKAAVAVFAHNERMVMIETNIRAALLHHLFPKSKKVPDSALERYLAYIIALPSVDPRTFYAAMMDYGSHLKQKYPNPSRRSKHHAKQKKLEGSDREIRGALLRAALGKKGELKKFDPTRVRALRKRLKQEGLF